MPFSVDERAALLALKGVGPTVISRLEQMGIDSLPMLGEANVGDILAKAAAALGSTCWKNSPQARAAITAAVMLAKQSNDSLSLSQDFHLSNPQHMGRQTCNGASE